MIVQQSMQSLLDDMIPFVNEAHAFPRQTMMACMFELENKGLMDRVWTDETPLDEHLHAVWTTRPGLSLADRRAELNELVTKAAED